MFFGNLFGWSPQRGLIEEKKKELEKVNNAMNDLSTVEASVESLENEISAIMAQIGAAYRVSSDASNNYMIDQINSTLSLTRTKLINKKSSLEDEISGLEAEEASYFYKKQQELKSLLNKS